MFKLSKLFFNLSTKVESNYNLKILNIPYSATKEQLEALIKTHFSF